MQTVAIEGKSREVFGKKFAKAARRENEIPCVLYGGEKNIHFSAPAKSFKHLIYTPDFKTAEISVDGATYNAILKDVQFHPVSDKLVHLDFVELVPGKQVKVDLPVQLVGVAEGVKLGGALMVKMRRVKVSTTPENLVDTINVNVEELLLGQSVRVSDAEVLEGVEILNPASNPIASVEVPRALKSAEAEEADAAAEGTDAVAEEAAAE